MIIQDITRLIVLLAKISPSGEIFMSFQHYLHFKISNERNERTTERTGEIMNDTYRPPNMKNRNNPANSKITKRMIIVAAVFLLLNILLFLPPVQNKIERNFFSNMKASGALENAGITDTAGGQADNETITGSLETCLVKISQKNQYGSGIIWELSETEAVFATAAHVVTDTEEEVRISFFNGYQAQAEIVYRAEYADVAFLSVPLENFENMAWADYTYVRMKREEELKTGDEILLFQDNKEVIRAKVLNPLLYMEDFREYMIWGEAEAVLGMSGSGVFDTAGNFVGILCGGNDRKEVAILPADIILKEYENCGR